jgi:hypothetical protein
MAPHHADGWPLDLITGDLRDQRLRGVDRCGGDRRRIVDPWDISTNGGYKRYSHQVASNALTEWNSSRRRRLQLIWDFRDRAPLPWAERQADMLLVVRLAAEFQGFARDLHDEAAGFLTFTATSGNQLLASVLRVGISSGRALNRNNAGSDTLATDFGRMGLIFWPAITAQDPILGPVWKTDLDNLVKMRNAIAHDNQAQILRLEQNGFLLERALSRRWHGSLDSLTATMDDVVASYLGALLGVPQPW